MKKITNKQFKNILEENFIPNNINRSTVIDRYLFNPYFEVLNYIQNNNESDNVPDVYTLYRIGRDVYLSKGYRYSNRIGYLLSNKTIYELGDSVIITDFNKGV